MSNDGNSKSFTGWVCADRDCEHELTHAEDGTCPTCTQELTLLSLWSAGDYLDLDELMA